MVFPSWRIAILNDNYATFWYKHILFSILTNVQRTVINIIIIIIIIIIFVLYIFLNVSWSGNRKRVENVVANTIVDTGETFTQKWYLYNHFDATFKTILFHILSLCSYPLSPTISIVFVTNETREKLPQKIVIK